MPEHIKKRSLVKMEGVCVEDEGVGVGVAVVAVYSVCTCLTRPKVREEARGAACESWGRECSVHSGLS